MIEPHPISKLAPTIARGVLAEKGPTVAGRPESVVIEFPNTDYQLHLRPTGPVHAEVGKRVLGTIRVEARRIDRVGTGGRYVEPIYGSPRRVQGTIVAIEDGTLIINAGMPIHTTPTAPGQTVDDFAVGDFVTFAAMPGATFTEQA
ncbi:MAG: hypothetical protein ACF8SC_06350 [Phycisphaerales bacterium JB037]